MMITMPSTIANSAPQTLYADAEEGLERVEADRLEPAAAEAVPDQVEAEHLAPVPLRAAVGRALAVLPMTRT